MMHHNKLIFPLIKTGLCNSTFSYKLTKGVNYISLIWIQSSDMICYKTEYIEYEINALTLLMKTCYLQSYNENPL